MSLLDYINSIVLSRMGVNLSKKAQAPGFMYYGNRPGHFDGARDNIRKGWEMVAKTPTGVAGTVMGGVAGVADAGKQYGWGSLVGLGNGPGKAKDAWSHAGRVLSESAKESVSDETSNRFYGSLGSAAANTAYNFLPNMVGIFSDKGAQKVQQLEDVIGMGKIKQTADEYNAKTQEAQFKKLYGENGWSDYVKDPDAFKKSHPEVAWAGASEVVGRGTLNMAASLKGFGMAGKALQPLQKVPVVGSVYKNPLLTSAAVGTVSGVKKGIETGSVLQGVNTGLNDAAISSMFLGGGSKPTVAFLLTGAATDPNVVQLGKDIYRKATGGELEFRDPEVGRQSREILEQYNQILDRIESDPSNNKSLYDIFNSNSRLLTEDQKRRLQGIGTKMEW